MARKSYWELLRDPRWQRRRLEIMQRAEFRCEQCEDDTTTLNVHHKLYRKGADPWEYEDHELQCLCETCHKSEHLMRERIAAALAAVDPYRMDEVLGILEAIRDEDIVFGEPENRQVMRLWKPTSYGHASGYLSRLTSERPSEQVHALIEAAPISDIDVFAIVVRDVPPSDLRRKVVAE